MEGEKDGKENENGRANVVFLPVDESVSGFDVEPLDGAGDL